MLASPRSSISVGTDLISNSGVFIMIIDYGYDVAFEVSGMGNFSDKMIKICL